MVLPSVPGAGISRQMGWWFLIGCGAVAGSRCNQLVSLGGGCVALYSRRPFWYLARSVVLEYLGRGQQKLGGYYSHACMGVALSSVCPLSSSTPHGHHTVGLPSTTTSHFFAPIEHCRSGRCPLPSHAPPRLLAAAQLSFSPGRRRGGCLLSQSIPSP